MTNPTHSPAEEPPAPSEPASESPPVDHRNVLPPGPGRPGGPGGAPPLQGTAPGHPRRFSGLLFDNEPVALEGADRDDRSFAADLNLDQVVGSIVNGREERDLLTTLLYRPLHDMNTVYYRQEVFRDLDDRGLFVRMKDFAEAMRQVRAHLIHMKKMQSQHQMEGWFLDAAAIYCAAVRALADDLKSRPVKSRGLLALRDFLATYMASAAFASLAADTSDCKDMLAQVRYSFRIRGRRVDVSRYEGEPDYSAEVLGTFDRFKQGAVKDYLVKYRTWPGLDHVGAQILQLVARLFTGEFTALQEYCHRHTGFLDETVQRFERELQFYLAYLDYIEPLRSAALPFCYPEVTTTSKEVFATDTFDLALAAQLAADGVPVIPNSFRLEGPERILVVSGPNQGGKTTLARTFGQLHHLASVGCPVPGSTARLYLFDRLFTHFEREEDISRMTGKLEDDLGRVREILQAATPDSIVILNEIFTSTTLKDARFLGKKVMAKLFQLDLLSVYVTFVDELASLNPSVVSMISTIVPEDPAQRTYRVVRGPANGLTYALAIARKYNLTYDQLRGRVAA